MLYRADYQHLYGIERRRITVPETVTMRLGRLEKPEPWPQALLDEIAKAPDTLLNWYPDYTAFYATLAAFAGAPPERLVVGLGVEDFIRTLVLLACAPGERMGLLWPSCAMFDLYPRIWGAACTRIAPDPRRHPTADEIAASIEDDCRLFVMANPGQPVETCYTPEEITVIAARCDAIACVLAVDEAYYGFGAPTALPLVECFDNLLVLRSFSKAFGAASLRLGYAVGQQRALKPLDAVRPSGEATGPSMHAATVLMRNWDKHVKPVIDETCRGRDWLREAAKDLGLHAWGRCANHVLIEVGDAEGITARLAERGVMVRVAGDTPALSRCILVTCGSQKLMRQFYGDLRECLTATSSARP